MWSPRLCQGSFENPSRLVLIYQNLRSHLLWYHSLSIHMNEIASSQVFLYHLCLLNHNLQSVGIQNQNATSNRRVQTPHKTMNEGLLILGYISTLIYFKVILLLIHYLAKLLKFMEFIYMEIPKIISKVSIMETLQESFSFLSLLNVVKWRQPHITT